jgi:transcriptional regulator with XRE-family HTH domain
MPKGTNSGGNRQGAGRKPKALTVVPQTNNNAEPCTNHDLPHQQVACIAMMARGMKQVRIAEQLGVAEYTISQWKQNPAFQQALAEVQARMLADPMAALDPMIPKALGKLEQALDQDEDLKLAVGVAESVMDRRYGKAIVRQASANVSHVTINIVSNKESDAGVFVEKDEYTEGEFTEVDPVY